MYPFAFPGLGQPYPEPSAAARTTARACRDHFVAFQLEGFSEAQALHLVSVLVIAGTPKGDTR